MKKILFFITMFLCGLNITYASNKIHSIDISVYIDEDGNANIEEIWTVDGQDGTEWYKVLNNLGYSELSDFKVSMDGKELTYKKWNVKESLSEKRGYYGIVNTSKGYELCFGKYDYKKHVFTLNYKLSNFVFNADDAQIIYFNFIDVLSGVNFDDFSLEISTYYDLPDTIDVWGYGYKGYAYVEHGKIKMSNESDMDNKYVVLLAKFPLNTFNTTARYSNISTFDDVYQLAEENSYDYNYDEVPIMIPFFVVGGYVVFIFMCVFGVFASVKYNKYGYIDNKTITKSNTPYFRDIPCNKDIYYASALANLNNFSKETNILGAVFLKWIKEGVVSINKDSNGNSNLVLQHAPENELEQSLYKMVNKASQDGVLEKKELEKWARKNYSEYLSLFTRVKNEGIDKLKTEGHIFKRTSKQQCKYKNVMDDVLYEESKKLYGLKLFLDDFSNIKDREAIEVNLWNEYLMFAYIFGNARKVMEQFKNLYPEIEEEMGNYNLDYNTLIFLNNISHSSVSAAHSARSAAQSYSGGGGGFSSGGGGGGSFGGGGGGSR